MVAGPIPSSSVPRTAVVVPVKAFSAAKARLSPGIEAPIRAALARAMATQVLASAGPIAAFVVCDDAEVRAWADQHGASVVWTPGLGLNGAVEAGVAHVAQLGFDEALVVHADLPLATDLSWLAGHRGVTLVPDRHRDGTNVVGVPTGAGFRFAYGPASFTRHQAEAARIGQPVRTVVDEQLGWDVDVAGDLSLPEHLHLPADVLAVLANPAPSPAEAPCR